MQFKYRVTGVKIQNAALQYCYQDQSCLITLHSGIFSKVSSL